MNLLENIQAKIEEIEDEVRSLEEVEPEAEIEVKEDDSKDIITFRGDETTEENNNIEELYDSVDYKTLADAIQNSIPGFYGYYFLNHFLPYL